MNDPKTPTWIAFANTRRIAMGTPQEVAAEAKRHVDSHALDQVAVLNAHTSETVEIDLRGSLSDVLERLPAAPTLNPNNDVAQQAPTERSVGRPKLGVTPREVTLLPRHWAWLGTQPGGASTTLRKLVEHAMRDSKEADRVRQIEEITYRFMHAMAGDRPGFEEAARALFANDFDRLGAHMAEWPGDIREHALHLALQLCARGHALERTD